jgi:hypothetical protein
MSTKRLKKILLTLPPPILHNLLIRKILLNRNKGINKTPRHRPKREMVLGDKKALWIKKLIISKGSEANRDQISRLSNLLEPLHQISNLSQAKELIDNLHRGRDQSPVPVSPLRRTRTH